MKYGFIKSELDGTEKIYQSDSSLELPKEYSYYKNLPQVLNQGSLPICVPCSIEAFVDWKLGLIDGKPKNNDVDLKAIFKNGGTEEGMTFKDALHFMRHEGVKTDKGLFKIDQYAMVGSIPVLKHAIIMNGPCIGGLPVRDSYAYDFWNGNGFEGGHAIAIVGYTEEGFIIRNSWGYSFGENGYAILPYEDFENFYEIWTLI